MPIDNLYNNPEKPKSEPLNNLYSDIPTKEKLDATDLYKENTAEQQSLKSDNVNKDNVVTEPKKITGETIDTTVVSNKPTTDLGNLYK